jgi:hypothetical protein
MHTQAMIIAAPACTKRLATVRYRGSGIPGSARRRPTASADHERSDLDDPRTSQGTVGDAPLRPTGAAA